MAIKTFSVANVKYNGTGGTAIGNIQSAVLTVTVDTAEITSFGDTWKKYLQLGKGWTLTVTAGYDNTDTAATGLRTEWITGDCVVTSVTMYETASCYFMGDSILTGYTMNQGVNGIDTYTVTFLGNATAAYTAG